MTEYRIADLARVSGVTSRNIRAYRERGLLDPPRRQGREAYYDDRHLAQLEVINQLLAKGFTSAHIATFIDGIRQGHDLSEVLGVPPVEAAGGVALDALTAAAQRAVRYGLGRVVDGRVVITDPAIARALAAAEDPEYWLTVMTEVLDTTGEVIDDLALRTVAVLRSGAMSGSDRDGIEHITKRALLSRLQTTFDEHVTQQLSEYEAS